MQSKIKKNPGKRVVDGFSGKMKKEVFAQKLKY